MSPPSPASRPPPAPLTLPVPGRRAAAFGAWFAPGADEASPGVVLLDDSGELDEDARRRCERLADEGFHTLCPDLHWRRAAAQAPTPRALDADQGVNDLQIAVDWLGDWPPTPPSTPPRAPRRRVGVVGLGAGGLLSFRGATCGRLDAAVVYDALGLERFLDEVPSLGCPLLVHLPERDESTPPGTRRAVAQALERARGVELHRYAGTQPGFAGPDGPRRDAAAATLAGARTLAFLRRHLRATAP